ncbi:hypothetical protein KCP77_24930 (plasmid) [Salmonella enterica subsp. enterica]|nr:hypothetical protein KCP77_24930 [Salmonella enterica subsp. enterica]
MIWLIGNGGAGAGAGVRGWAGDDLARSTLVLHEDPAIGRNRHSRIRMETSR